MRRESTLVNYERCHYKTIFKLFAGHETVEHTRDEYVRGDACTNTLERVYSIFKYGMKGVCQHCGEKHAHRHLAEFDFSYNNCSAVGLEDGERATKSPKGIVGKRLTYRLANQSQMEA